MSDERTPCRDPMKLTPEEVYELIEGRYPYGFGLTEPYTAKYQIKGYTVTVAGQGSTLQIVDVGPGAPSLTPHPFECL